MFVAVNFLGCRLLDMLVVKLKILINVYNVGCRVFLVVLNELRHLSTRTSILSDPGLLSKEAVDHVTKQETNNVDMESSSDNSTIGEDQFINHV